MGSIRELPPKRTPRTSFTHELRVVTPSHASLSPEGRGDLGCRARGGALRNRSPGSYSATYITIMAIVSSVSTSNVILTHDQGAVPLHFPVTPFTRYRYGVP